MQLDFTMYNRNQKRDDDGVASLGEDDAQANVTGKGGIDGQYPHQFEWNQFDKQVDIIISKNKALQI